MSAPLDRLPVTRPVSVRRDRLRLLLRSGTFLSGFVIVSFWVVCALFGQALAPIDPYADDLLNALTAPSSEHWFGTDSLGRDVFSRVIVGARDILTVALLATALGTALGTTLGLVAGYFRGIIDDVLGRVIEALMALPLAITAMLGLVAMGTSITTLIVVIGVVFAPIIARTVRAAVLSERTLDYVAIAQLRGERAIYIMFAEILPNIIAPLLVEFTVRLGYAIFTLAVLSFLYFGIQPPSPDWGLAIADNYGLIGSGFWWTVLFNALAIGSLVIGINLLADGIQQAYEA
ncbi:MAG: ABC transporter permease [Gammaproteobacteria bacterium]|nr:ABC transporter permease [Gammaproteobacteria bacterium]